MPRIATVRLWSSVLCSSLAWASVGTAQDEAKQRCLDAYEAGQRLQRESKLIEAKENLVFCGSSECPAVMHADCQHWLAQVQASTPTVVFGIETASGAAATSSNVTIDDGDPIPLDGRAIEVNPGRHRVTFSADGLEPQSKGFVFAEGEKLRREVVVLSPPLLPGVNGVPAETPAPPVEWAPAPGFTVTAPMIIAASAAVVGGVGFAYFGSTARANDSSLDDCSPNCSQARVDGVKRDYLFANLSLGLGAAGLVSGAVLVGLEYRASRAPRAASVQLSLLPSARGLSLTGSF